MFTSAHGALLVLDVLRDCGQRCAATASGGAGRRTKIENATKAERDTSSFYGEWRKIEKKGRSGTYIPPAQMPPGLAATVAGLRSRYTVSSMAGLLHMSENTLRHFLLKHFGEPPVETAAGDTETAEAEELVPVKEESPEPGPSAGYPVAGWTPEPREEPTLYTRSFGGLSPDAEASYEPPGTGPGRRGPSTVSFGHPAVTGYTVVVDAYGQRLYQEDDTGDLSVRDPRTGRMSNPDEDVETTG
ncbi:hypothetical protein ACH4M0_00015 [Streptomyces albidoflavus]